VQGFCRVGLKKLALGQLNITRKCPVLKDSFDLLGFSAAPTYLAKSWHRIMPSRPATGDIRGPEIMPVPIALGV